MNVESLVVCQYDGCNMIFQDPITIPCGNSLCKKHLEKFVDKFECNFCQQVHRIPENGFFTSHIINQIVDKYFESDPLRREIKSLFDTLNSIIYENEKLDPEEYVFDHIREIINKVDLHREELIKEINHKSDEIINKLKEREKQCISNATKLKKMNFEQLKTSDLPVWKNLFRKSDLKLNELNDLLAKMNNKLKSIRNQTKEYKNNLLLNETIFFEKYEKCSLFGKLVFYSNRSKILSKDCGQLIRNFKQHSDLINSIQVDEKSNKLISASDDKMIKIFNLATGECLKSLEEHQDWVTFILIIRNKFISASLDKTIKIWDINSYRCLKTLSNESPIFSLCLLQNSHLACGCEDGSIDIWDLNTFRKVKSFKAHDDWIPYLLFVDNSKLISCSADKIIKIWSSMTFECLIQLENHSDEVYCLDLTSDRRLISCSLDKTIKLWQTETGTMLESIDFQEKINYRIMIQNIVAFCRSLKDHDRIFYLFILAQIFSLILSKNLLIYLIVTKIILYNNI